jgi:hypothetical protein
MLFLVPKNFRLYDYFNKLDIFYYVMSQRYLIYNITFFSLKKKKKSHGL